MPIPKRLLPIARSVLVVGVMALAVKAEDGQLHRFEDKAKPSTTKPAPIYSSDSCHGRWQDQHPGEPMPDYFCQSGGEAVGSFFADLFLQPIVLGIFGAPFYLPAVAVDDHYDVSKTFQSYPYQKASGYVVPGGKYWLINAGASHQWVSHGLKAWRGDISGTSESRLGMDISYTRYEEHAGDELDTLAILDLVPTFSFARSESWDWRAGIGLEAIQGREQNLRTKVVYKIRRFFRAPFRVDCDFGASFSSGRPIFEIAPSIAYHFNRYELKATYRRVNVSDVVLEGPEVTLGVWF